jgi:hypothetical protein
LTIKILRESNVLKVKRRRKNFKELLHEWFTVQNVKFKIKNIYYMNILKLEYEIEFKEKE